MEIIMSDRIKILRENMLKAKHSSAREEIDSSISFAELPLSLPERRAAAISYIFENMPIYIGEHELIVGSRTLLSRVDNPECDPSVTPDGKSLLDLNTMPQYINDNDRKKFRGFDLPNNSQLHNVADYSILLKNGIKVIIERAETAERKAKSVFRAEYARAMAAVYRAFSKLIMRYSEKASEMAEYENDECRKAELKRISEICRHISTEPPRDYYEAAQLFWLAHIGVLCDNFRGMSYGRVDSFLYPFYDKNKHNEIEEITACLLIKFSDSCDLYHYQMGQYNSQHNITLGGVLPNGDNAVNELTYIFIDSLDKVRLEEPEVACRINSKNPPEFLDRLSKLSESGLNTLAYYNDDKFIENLTNAGIPPEDARDYAFDLCQDIMIPGRCQIFRSGDVNLTKILLKTLEKAKDNCTFEEFIALYERDISAAVDLEINSYNKFEKVVLRFADGDTEEFYSADITEPHIRAAAASLMSPLSFTSAMIEGALDIGGDIDLIDYRLKQKGLMISGLTVAVNSLSALRKRVFDEKRYSLSEIREALDKNFEGFEVMRHSLLSAPKWGNDDDCADLPGIRIMEHAAKEISKRFTFSGVRHLSGFHQPHPVFAGWNTPATPDGRFSGTPIPVSLSPAAGTMKNGPISAMRSAAKLSPEMSEWNNCLMLEYSSSVFEGTDGVLASLTRSYFDIGGMQHQPNSVSAEDLLDAQKNPDAHRDLIIRMWGVSARFVTLSREVQDEFISRLR
ncbi:MAG: hypothetical protein HFE30_02900 [Clostridiales bacterium]|nr:hypothetical protein [Clostridiales bacterium]